MKRKISILLILIFIINIIPLNVLASNDIKVLLNGQEINFDVSPQIISNRTMVPMRAIFEKLNMNVEYSNGNITASNDSNIIKMTINSEKIYVNGVTTFVDTAPIIINNRTLVPLRAISECLGANVQWNGDTRTVSILTDPSMIAQQQTDLLMNLLNDHKYMAYSDFRAIKRKYPTAAANYASMVHYTKNVNRHSCVLVYIKYEILNNDYNKVILHDLTTGETLNDPETYYEEIIDRNTGVREYWDLSIEVSDNIIKALEVIEGKNNEGIFISGHELNFAADPSLYL